MTALVIGVGCPDGGDDAVGLRVAELVRLSGPLAPRVVTTTVPLSLLDLWGADDDVVVVDAVRGAGRPGAVTVRRLERPAPGSRPGARGTHGFGVAEAVALAAALDRLPRNLVLVGIELADPAELAPGRALSPAVEASLPAAVTAVLASSEDFRRRDRDL